MEPNFQCLYHYNSTSKFQNIRMQKINCVLLLVSIRQAANNNFITQNVKSGFCPADL